ncbi:heterokaryon incompatibility protein-domain-containing protein [Hypoxylon sp. FL1150]|nr:heterokaryon incompatibility protein-domain-containing protein [Hypoxylon sp. FL1150]
MRLLNTVRYAILSHTWGTKEITFDDLSQPDHQQKPEYAKIEGCCQQAIRDRHTYVWVYYVYLVEVPTGQDPFLKDSAFKKGRWFTRGWTLQELLAPDGRTFLDIDITGIHQKHIVDSKYIHETTVALRLSWASRRSTSQQDDQAYCLLGLMGANMPLLYGEGDKVFLRLQEEIVKKSSDLSILAHGRYGYVNGIRDRVYRTETVLAKQPSDFQELRNDISGMIYFSN